jgi:hypothetical protein
LKDEFPSSSSWLHASASTRHGKAPTGVGVEIAAGRYVVFPVLWLQQPADARLHNFPVIAQKSQKWMQMQRKRYGEKRKGGFVDMGKQVRVVGAFLSCVWEISTFFRTSHRNTSAKLSKTMVI